MNMKTIRSEKRLCTCCMEEHEVKTVVIKEETRFKNVKVEYEAQYFYCDMAEELYMNEQQMRDNDVRMKDAYRREQGLLTSFDICKIRERYKISQRDFCVLLGWGEKTITRYEGYQVQDKAHDTILRKINLDPEWFLMLLEDTKEKLSPESYENLHENAVDIYWKERDGYLRKAIEADYSRFAETPEICGNTKLSLEKVVDVIRYFASSTKVKNLYKVKLMKLMWYADAYSYKQRGCSMTGLVYQALPMGAVPVGHDSIINLKGVPCEEVDMGEVTAYFFSLKGEKEFPALSGEDKHILEYVLEKLGGMTKDQIVSFMHKEIAYKRTEPRDMISFAYAKDLQI